MKIRTIKILSMAFVIFGMVSPGLSLTITPNSTPQWQDNTNPPNYLGAEGVKTLVGYSGSLTLLYKQDVGESSDEGPFASSYNTTFDRTASDPQDAEIKFVTGQSFIQGSPLFLYVKDGNHNPQGYVFGLNYSYNGSYIGWDGKETILVKGFWPDRGAISNVSIFGVVPEPGTLFLLGAGIGALACIGRRKRDWSKVGARALKGSCTPAP